MCRFRLNLFIAICLVFSEHCFGADFGVEGGRGVKNSSEALAEANGGSQPDLEIIFSYAMFPHKIAGVEDINPFGHIAFGIRTAAGYRIVTVNQKAVPGVDKLFFQLPPEDYFYRTEPLEGAIHGSHIGLAYARSSVAIQLRGIESVALDRIRERLAAIERQHEVGTVNFCVNSNNCAHLTTKMLSEAGIVSPQNPSRFPAAAFDQALDYGERSGTSGVKSTVVFYRKLVSDHHYQLENVPAPGYKFFATIMSMLGYNSLRRVSGPAIVIGASSDQEKLSVSRTEQADAIADTCSRIWIAPFIRAILRRS